MDGDDPMSASTLGKRYRNDRAADSDGSGAENARKSASMPPADAGTTGDVAGGPPGPDTETQVAPAAKVAPSHAPSHRLRRSTSDPNYVPRRGEDVIPESQRYNATWLASPPQARDPPGTPVALPVHHETGSRDLADDPDATQVFDIPIPVLPVHGSQSTLDLDASSECSERGGELPGALPGASEALPSTPGHLRDHPGAIGLAPGGSRDVPGAVGLAPGGSRDVPGAVVVAPGGSGNTPEHSRERSEAAEEPSRASGHVSGGTRDTPATPPGGFRGTDSEASHGERSESDESESDSDDSDDDDYSPSVSVSRISSDDQSDLPSGGGWSVPLESWQWLDQLSSWDAMVNPCRSSIMWVGTVARAEYIIPNKIFTSRPCETS